MSFKIAVQHQNFQKIIMEHHGVVYNHFVEKLGNIYGQFSRNKIMNSNTVQLQMIV